MDLLNTLAGTVALAVENARVTEELKEAYNEVSSLNAVKGRTINHLSHELKTPLQTATMATDLLMNEMKGIQEPKSQKLIQLIQKSIKRILDIQQEAGPW